MCGIIGLYLKTPDLEPELGRLTALMLHEMSSRGPDSAGFAVYGGVSGVAKLSALSRTGETNWANLEQLYHDCDIAAYRIPIVDFDDDDLVSKLPTATQTL